MSAPRDPVTLSDWSSEHLLLNKMFGEHDGRFVVWKNETRNGKPTKVPYRPSGNRMARSNDPRTWGPFARARDTLTEGGFAGMGFMLGDLGDGRFLVGKDWDLCRNPTTGEIAAWAREDIARWRSYCEISPSGTGVKGYGYHDDVPPDGRKEITIDAPIPPGAEDSGHSKPEIGLYPGFDPRRPPAESKGRYFALTGLHLPGTPCELRDVTAEYGRTLAEFGARSGKPAPRGKANGHAIEEVEPATGADADAILASLRENDRDFAAAWDSGVEDRAGT